MRLQFQLPAAAQGSKRPVNAVLIPSPEIVGTRVVSATSSCGHYGLIGFNECSGVGQTYIPRQELFDAIDRVVRDTSEDVGQIGFRIEAVQFGRADHAVFYGTAST